MKKRQNFKERDIVRITILEQIINKQITRDKWALLIGLSYRQISRLLNKYKQKWPQWIIHKLIWKKWNRNTKIDENIILDIIKNPKFEWFKPTLLSEKLLELYQINISKEGLRQIMINNNLRTPKTNKTIKYRWCRPRKQFYWEIIQFDWSYHKRFEDRNDEYFCLLLAVDDATWKIMLAIFTDNESYINISFFRTQYILKYWIPYSIYLDKFSTYKVNYPKATLDKNLKTDFDKCMKNLGCKLIFAHSPQAKWRVEKYNWILQDRLVKEMRLRNISTIEQANIYLNDFIEAYNEKFAVDPQRKENLHRPIWDEIIDNIDWIFARKNIRSLWNDYIIQYKSRFYQIKETKNACIYPKKRLSILENNNWAIRILIDNIDLQYKELDQNVVKLQRAKYRSQKKNIEKEKIKISIEKRKENNFQNSKKRQYKRKASDLIKKNNL